MYSLYLSSLKSLISGVSSESLTRGPRLVGAFHTPKKWSLSLFTAEESFDSSKKLSGIERLGDIFVATKVEPFELVFFLFPHGQHNDGKMLI